MTRRVENAIDQRMVRVNRARPALRQVVVVTTSDAQVDPALRSNGGLAEQERRHRRLADAFDDRGDERLVHVRGLRDERERFVLAVELDQSGENV